jgi:hypothetical protein
MQTHVFLILKTVLPFGSKVLVEKWPLVFFVDEDMSFHLSVSQALNLFGTFPITFLVDVVVKET